MLALSDQATTGWFTLGAAVAVSLVTGFFNWLGRKSDQEAAERRREGEAADRREERRAADLAQWRDAAAEVLGRVREFMTDVHAQRVTINFQPGTEGQVIKTLNEKWESLREPIARLAVGHPSARGRELADEVVSGLHRTLNMTAWALTDLAAHRPFTEALNQAMKEWEQLDSNVKELREALHEGS